MGPHRNVHLQSTLAVLALGISISAHGATQLNELRYNADITTVVGAPAVILTPGSVAIDLLAGPVGLINIGSIPAGANVVAYHRALNGDALLVTDTVAVLGGNTFGPRDVVRYNGAGYSSFFAGAANGIPDGVRIVGVALVNNADPLLAFDTTVVLSGITVKPADIVRWNGSGYTLFFDSAAAGVVDGITVQDFHFLDSNSHLLLSFGTSGSVGGIIFDRSDVLEYTPGAPGVWELAYSGTSHSGGWAAADLKALFAVAGAPGPSGTAAFPALSDAALLLLAFSVVAITFFHRRKPGERVTKA